MAFDFTDLDPVRRLALVYARQNIKPIFALLLSLDARFADVVLKASEPMIAQMKLAWWREAVMASFSDRPGGEPLLAVLTACEQEGHVSGLSADIDGLIQAWQLLATNDDWTVEVRTNFAKLRAEAIFGGYVRWICGNGDNEYVLIIGQQWASAELAIRTGKSSFAPIQKAKMPRRFRPLSILHFAAQRELHDAAKSTGLGLVWHALTGR